MMRTLPTISVASLALLATAVSAATITLKDGVALPDSTTYTGTTSTTIRSDNTSYNDGNGSKGTTLLVGNQPSAGRDFRGLISFNLAYLKSLVGANQTLTINSITLSVSLISNTSGTGAMSVNVSSYATNPLTATWANPTGVAGGDVAGGTPGTTLATISNVITNTPTANLPVTYTSTTSQAFIDAATAAIASSSVTLSMMLWNDATTGSNFARLGEDTYAYTSSRPALTIDYTISSVPEPASLAVLALGGMMLIRRRK